MSRAILLLLLLAAAATAVPAARAQCGEAPTDGACAPRYIPGDPGAYEVVMGLATATPDFTTACGYNVGHTVWFEVTPTTSGLVTVSTCTPGTTFDTVIQIWKSTGDCEFPLRLDDQCNDDTVEEQCSNGCGTYRGSEVSFMATAGVTYLIQVGSYNNNAGGCTLCLDLLVSICGGDSTPPEASITSPIALECNCDSVYVTGYAYDPGSAIDHYTLDYKRITDTAWTEITTSSIPVYGGTLATWYTAGLPEDYYLLRLTTVDKCGLSNTAVQVVWVCQQFDSVVLGTPAEDAIVGGLVCLAGTVWDGYCFDYYTADYKPFGGLYQPISPGPSYSESAKVNELIAAWDTSAGVADGTYTLRVTGADACGHTLTQYRDLVVDNTAPTAVITEPANCSYADPIVEVYGTATDAHLSYWVLQYTGGTQHGWVTIDDGTSPVVNGLLGVWDTRSLPSCAYTLRLLTYDASVVQTQCGWPSYHQSEYTTSVLVADYCPVDLDGDADEDLLDYGMFQECFTGPG